MNTKQKADQLVFKFAPHVTTWDCYNDSPQNEKIILKEAKKYALIAVDEIIEALTITTGHLTPSNRDFLELQRDYQFWDDVKKELHSL